MASVQIPNSQEHRPPPKASQFSTRPPHTPRGELDQPGVDPAEAASLWAIATRRNIDLYLESNLPIRPQESDKLIKELSAVFIAALQRDSLKQWQYVNEVLKILEPYVNIFDGNKQLNHYIQRIVFHAGKLNDQSLANEILQSVDKLFFKSEVKKTVITNGDHRNYRTPVPRSSTNGSSTLKNTVQFSLPDGSDPYRPPSQEHDVTIKPKGISFGDLTDVMPSVIQETVKHDAIWSEGLGLTAAALNIKLPQSKSETPSRDSIPPRQPDPTWVSSDKETKAKRNVKISQENEAEPIIPLTGKEVVELFGKGRHLGKAKFVYLNRAQTRHFRPYDLIVVPQHKANPEEHWTVSCFGIMYKVRGHPAESMALYDWHREAVLWSALMKIPLFKYFLVRKAFQRWRSNQKFSDFSSTRRRVESRLLQSIPRFGTALLQISKLLQELNLLKLLPLEPNHCFALSEFDFTVLKKYREGKLILGKFFKFCRLIMDKTCKDSFDKLKFCESQTKQDKAVFSKESLFVQRQKKEQREKNLAEAQEEASCLGNFVLLVDQILVSHLLALTRVNVCTFIDGSMAAGPDCERDALFTAKLIFTNKHTLTLFPSKEKFRESLNQTLDNIPALITEMSKPMEELTAGLVSPDIPEEGADYRETGTGTTPDPAKVAIQLEEPQMPDSVRPRKSRDNMGVATPSYCLPGVSQSDLAIVGKRMVGQYNPLSHGNLLQRLSQDEEVRASRNSQISLMDSAMADVDAFCEEHSWLTEIHSFVKTWTKESAKSWRRAQAFSIEAKLAEIRDWTEKVRNVDRLFVTNNALFLVDCESIQNDLVPPLDAAFKDLLNFTASEALAFARAFTEEIKGVVADMKEKNPDTAAFADYAQQYHTYKNKMADLQKEVDYIKSLFEVIRLSYRSLTPEEEKHEEQVWQNWEMFLLQLQDAAEFVHTQMPIKTDELATTFQKYMAEAVRVFTKATSGIYLDPSQNSTRLLSSVMKLFDQFYHAQAEITKCNDCRKKILGETYDITELNKMLSLMRVRAELWKYLEASTAAIQDWKMKVFKKFDVQRAIDKITEWQRAAGHLKQHLPQADPVLAFWYKMLSDFKQDLPLLLKLSSDALKPRHWRAIFLAIGQTYEKSQQYRVSDLLSYNIAENSLAINNICSGATAEFTLEKSLIKLRNLWEDNDFKLAKHLHRHGISYKMGQPLNSMEQPEVYFLIKLDELKYLLEDSQVSLQNMLVSPHLADLQPAAELWRSTLWQVSELVELIQECQAKWLYLYKIFSDAEQAVYDPELTVKYEMVDRKFQEIMKAIVADPKVLSILNKRKGQKGWRELQGDNLKEVLLFVMQTEEELLQELDHHLTDARLSFPRFFFLCDCDLIDLLAHPSDRHQWIPYIRKLFPGIREVTLALTSDPYGIQSHLDLQLHADKLGAVAVRGDLNEDIKLVRPVAANPNLCKWWSSFEASVKSTVGSILHSCLEARLRDGATGNPERILEELASLEGATGYTEEQQDLKQAVKQSFSHWLLRFPSQCVLIGEAVLWFRQMEKILKDGDKENLEKARDKLQKRLTQYTVVLRDNVHMYLNSPSRARLHILLSNLVIQTLQYRDIVEGLLTLSEVDNMTFDWQKVMRYSMDISTTLCLQKTQEPNGSASKSQGATTVSTQYLFGPCHVNQLGSSFAYDYEYLGPSLQLVTTPLTERCHLALTNAMKGFECGTVLGPSSSGKTDSVKDLAQAMGHNLLVVDCTGIKNVRTLNNLLCGVVQSGSWGLLENPQSMGQGLMSVLAQQLQHIVHAYQVLHNEKYDDVYNRRGKSAVKHLRRHSVTSLHSVSSDVRPTSAKDVREKIFITARNEDPDTSKRLLPGLAKTQSRRHSIVKGRMLSVSDYYTSTNQPVPLFTDRPKSAQVGNSPTLHHWTYQSHTAGHLNFSGHLIQASSNFACFMTFTTNGFLNPEVPATLRALMRPTYLMSPELSVILETNLICSGFQEHQGLSSKLCSFARILAAQFPDHPEFHLDLRVMKSLVDVAALRMYSKRNLYELAGRGSSLNSSTPTSTPNLGMVADQVGSLPDSDLINVLEQDDLHKEETALVFAIQLHLLTRLSSQDQQQSVRDLLRCVFPWSGGGARPSTGGHEHDPVLVDAIQSQFVADKLQATPQHVNKVIELHQSLQHKCGVILVGPAGSGKTVCYHTLARVLSNLHHTPPPEQAEVHHVPQVPRMKGLVESSPRPHSSTIHRLRFKAEVISRVTLQWLDTATKGKKTPEYPSVDVSVLYPATLTLSEIIGEWNEDNLTWRDGLLTRLVRESQASTDAAKALTEEQMEKAKSKKPFGKGLLNPPSIIERWAVMDGGIDISLSELLHPVTKRGTRRLTLANGEQLIIPSCLSMVLETTDLSQVSPAMVSDCAVLHFGNDVVHWRCLLDSWLGEVKTLWDCSNPNFQLLNTLISDTLPATLDFFSQSGSTFVLETDQTSSEMSKSLAPGLREISAFTRIMGALFDLYLKRDDGISQGSEDEKEVPASKLSAASPSVSMSSRPASCNPSVLISSIFVFAYVWGFGGHLHDRYWEKFEAFARHILSRCSVDIFVPSDGSIFDYHVDPHQGILVPFADKSQERVKTLPSGYMVIPQMERYSHLVDLLLPTSPVVLCGPPGVGKSALVQNLIHPKHPYSKIHFSPALSQSMLEESLVTKLRPMSVVLNPSLSNKTTAPSNILPMFFLDDLNCCSKDFNKGGIPNLELVRQLLSQGGFYNHGSLTFQMLEHFKLLGLCTPPSEPGVGTGYACHSLGPRLTRLVTVLNFSSPDVETVMAMHCSSLTNWLEEFPAYSLAHHQELAKAMLSATVAIHDMVKRHLTCTPANPHYVFSHHDIHHVIQGLHLLSARSRGDNRPKHGQRRVGGAQGRRQSQASHRGSLQLMITPPMMRSVVRLWCHEVTRTYSDRLISEADKDWFSETLEETVQHHFCTGEEPKVLASPSLILEEPSLSSHGGKGSPDGEKRESPIFDEEDLTGLPNDASPDQQKGDTQVHVHIAPTLIPSHLTTSLMTALTASSTSISLPAITSPPVSDLDSEDYSDSHTVLSAALDKEQPPLPPIAVKDPITSSSSNEEPLKPHPPPPLNLKSILPGSQLAGGKSRRSSKEDKGPRTPRRSVSFKPGLIGDILGDEIYTGPLIAMDQLRSPDEKLTDIVLSKFIAKKEKDSEKGYMECTSPELKEGLRKVLHNYNETASTKMNLAFFKATLYHMARLSRVLATPGGNALLMGQMHATGRTSLARLAAFAARCKFYTCHPGHSESNNQHKLRSVLKKASQLAGVYGKPVVLLVKSRLGEVCMQDLCCFLKEGTCPELYTQDELTHIIGQMLPGAKPPRGSRAEIALEKFFTRVQTYLHVIISMDCEGRGFLQKFPTLLLSSLCVDVYQPWSQEAFAQVAEYWIQVPTSDPFTGKLIETSWRSKGQPCDITGISGAMAYMHLTSQKALRQYHQKDLKVYSPATFLDFLDLFKNLMWKIAKEEKSLILKYQSALDKINESLDTIQKYQSEVESLKPQYQLAVEIAQQKQQEVETYQQEYADANGHCAQDEAEISEMQKPLTEMKKKAQAELDRVNPVYEAALHALRSLNSSALDEIRTFRKPPEMVVKVVNALCLLFGEPYGWQSGKTLINRDNFFQDLEFYNKANMPEDVFHKLNVLFIQDKTFTPENVAKSSLAARSLCMWLHAVYAYALIHRNMRPKINMVEEAQVKLHEAQSHLGEKRVKAQNVQGLLEQKVKEYQESLVHVHDLDRAMKALEDQIAEASHLMMNMETQHLTWKSSLDESQSNLSTSAGDALVTAACASYHGPMEQSIRNVLLADWIKACQSGMFYVGEGDESDPPSQLIPLRSNFSLKAILSSKDEQQLWNQKGLPEDPHATNNALFIRACTIAMKRHWPLLLDPNDQAVTWIKLLQERGMVSFHEGPDLEEDMRVESVSEREFGNVEMDVAEPSSDDDGTDDKSTERESDSTPGASQGYPETPRTLTSTGAETVFRTPVQDAANVADSETDIFSTSQQTDQTPLPHDQQEIPKPPLELMVVASDDPSLPVKLCNAVVLGYSIMVTHIERTPFGEQFRDVLLRNITVGADGGKKVMIGSKEYPYNAKFKLFLSSSVSLGVQGDGFKPLPIRDTLLINMAVDQRGLQDILMQDVSLSERPEYKNQLKSIREDIRDQRITINQAEEEILKKIVQLPHGILDEENMLESLLHYQQVVLSTEATLQESITLQQQLLGKQQPFMKVAHHGTLLYRTIQKLDKLHPAYHVPLWCFQKWFSDGIRLRKKDQTNIAAPGARAVELINNLTRHIHQRVLQSCFPLHGSLFIFLVAVEKMRDSGELKDEEWELFVGGIDRVEDGEVGEKPEWMDMKVWLDCQALEKKMVAFKGLQSCLVQYSNQWKEYFEHQPILLSPVPGNILANLSIFQKAVLWRIVRPDKLASICHDVTVYQLGSSICSQEEHSLASMLPMLDPRTPLVYLIPGSYEEHHPHLSGMEGHLTTHPSTEVESICPQRGVEKSFHKLTLGTSLQMKEAVRMLRVCQQRGHWLLLDNCQAVEKWDADFLRELKLLLETPLDEPDKAPAKINKVPPQPSVHKDFRLFMVTGASSPNKLPGLIIKHSLTKVCTSPTSFKASLQYYFSDASSWLERKQALIPETNVKIVHEMLFNLAFLHTVLSHRLSYPRLGFKGDYFWNEKDLHTALDHLILTSRTSPMRSFSNLAKMVGTHIYGGHASNPEDLRTVQALADSILLSWNDIKQMPSSMGVGSLLASILSSGQSGSRLNSQPGNLGAVFQLMFDSLKSNVDPILLGLMKSAPTVIEAQQSSFVANTLSVLEMESPNGTIFADLRAVKSTLTSIQFKLCNFPELPIISAKDKLSHLENFITSEINLICKKVNHISQDVELLLSCLEGSLHLSTELEEMLHAVSNGRLPRGWGYPVSHFNVDLQIWLDDLIKKMEMLIDYQEKVEDVISFDVSAFLRPKMFVEALLMERARKEYMEIQDVVMEIETMPFEDPPVCRPESGSYLCGFYLHNASWDTQRIIMVSHWKDDSADHSTQAVKLPLMWFKPVHKHFRTPSAGSTRQMVTFKCPVFESVQIAGQSIDPVTHINLPCTLETKIWAQKRVFVTMNHSLI